MIGETAGRCLNWWERNSSLQFQTLPVPFVCMRNPMLIRGVSRKMVAKERIERSRLSSFEEVYSAIRS